MIVVNYPHLLSLHLIEVSSRSNRQHETLEFLRRHITRPRWKMFNLLKKLRLPSVFSKDEVHMMTNKLARMSTNNLDNVIEEMDCLKKSIE